MSSFKNPSQLPVLKMDAPARLRHTFALGYRLILHDNIILKISMGRKEATVFTLTLFLNEDFTQGQC